MIEPAAYGSAVAFGPNTSNFRDIVDMLLARQAAIVVKDGSELTRWLENGLRDPRSAEAMGSRAQELVIAQRGAAAATVASLLTLLPPASRSATRAA